MYRRQDGTLVHSRFSQKYYDHVTCRSWWWRVVSASSKGLFCGRDALFPLLRATDLHHLHYGRLGHEIPVVDVLPLHFITHRWIVEPLLRLLKALFGRRRARLLMALVTVPVAMVWLLALWATMPVLWVFARGRRLRGVVSLV